MIRFTPTHNNLGAWPYSIEQAISNVDTPQEEVAGGEMGSKISLLSYMMKHGPYALASLALAVALVYIGAVLIHQLESDRDLSASLIRTNVVLADSVGRVASSSEQVLNELRGFTAKVTIQHQQMNDLLMDHTIVLRQLLVDSSHE